MTSTQVPPPSRRRTLVAVAALAGTVLAVIATTGAAGGLWLTEPEASGDRADAGVTSSTSPHPGGAVAAVAASQGQADFGRSIPDVSVSLPPEPSPEPEPEAPTGGSPSGGSDAPPTTSNGDTPSGQASTESEPAQRPAASLTREEFCASPSVSASASSAQGLLSAANAERARLGLAGLSWSGSLASAAQAWSQSMADTDSASEPTMDALAHNPSRPAGGENVAVSYHSAGQSQGAAAAQAHAGWVKSHGHCMNMLSPSYSVMGAGMAVTQDGTTWYSTVNCQ